MRAVLYFLVFLLNASTNNQKQIIMARKTRTKAASLFSPIGTIPGEYTMWVPFLGAGSPAFEG